MANTLAEADDWTAILRRRADSRARWNLFKSEALTRSAADNLARAAALERSGHECVNFSLLTLWVAGVRAADVVGEKQRKDR